MNNKQIKHLEKQYEDGNYISVYSFDGNPWRIVKVKAGKFYEGVYRYRLILKKHQKHLEAFLYEKQAIGINGTPVKDFIESYDETYNYDIMLVDAKYNHTTHKDDHFNKHGFEAPEFEGEILKGIKGKVGSPHYLGYVCEDDCYFSCQWDCRGNIWDCDEMILKNFNLKRL